MCQTKFMKEIWQTGKKKKFKYFGNKRRHYRPLHKQKIWLFQPTSAHSTSSVMCHDKLAGPRDGRGEEWNQALEILRVFSDWSWNRFMRTEPKSRGSSMSRHPWSQFLLGSSIAGFCQVQRKFIISSFETGFPLIPNWLIRFSSLRPSYCPQAKGETISLWEFTWG